MKPWRISSRAVRTAEKMCKTIFERKRIPVEDANRLLNLATKVALHDLLDQRLEWASNPGAQSLYLKGSKAGSRPGGQIKRRFDEAEIDAAMSQAEAIFDEYQLDEDERDTLFTALPCLGLKALQQWLRWTHSPPFPEVG